MAQTNQTWNKHGPGPGGAHLKLKLATVIAGLIGLALATAIVVHEGLADILAVLAQAGPVLLWLVPFRALPIFLDVQGWRTLLAPRDPERRVRLPFLFWVATVREAVDRLLPVANVGGAIVGARLVRLRGLNGAAAAASVIVETLLSMISQFAFTGLGLVLLITLTHPTALAGSILSGAVLGLALPITVGLLLRYGSVFERLEKGIERLLGDRKQLAGLLDGSNLDAEIQALYRRRGRLLIALCWQLAGYLLSSFETWFALAALGHPVPVASAVALEALTQAVRNFVFFVPAGLGVQEAGLVLFGQMVGVGSEVAVALSLAKRMRELLFGIPALIAWQWFEGRRLVSAAAGGPGPRKKT